MVEAKAENKPHTAAHKDTPAHAAVVPAEAQAEANTINNTAGNPETIVTNVWAPSGPVPKGNILQTAIQSVRDAIPVIYDLQADITGAQKEKVGDRDGTTFEVTITYTPRKVAGGRADPIDVDKVTKALEAPTHIDLRGHDGDPDFLETN